MSQKNTGSRYENSSAVIVKRVVSSNVPSRYDNNLSQQTEEVQMVTNVVPVEKVFSNQKIKARPTNLNRFYKKQPVLIKNQKINISLASRPRGGPTYNPRIVSRHVVAKNLKPKSTGCGCGKKLF